VDSGDLREWRTFPTKEFKPESAVYEAAALSDDDSARALDELTWGGARRMIAAALEIEVDDYRARLAGATLGNRQRPRRGQEFLARHTHTTAPCAPSAPKGRGAPYPLESSSAHCVHLAWPCDSKRVAVAFAAHGCT